MPSKYKLTYFDAPGRAEVTRLIFHAAGVEFDDERVSDWPAKKNETPIGQMPVLTVDGVKLPQSLTIARYAAKVCNLAGKDALEQAKVDAVADTVDDMQDAWIQKVYFSQDKLHSMKKFIDEDAPIHFAKIEKLIGMYGANGYAVGNGLTWADLFLLHVSSTLGPASVLLAKYPRVQASVKHAEANKNVVAYLKRRPPPHF